jgi:hypothetical protein
MNERIKQLLNQAYQWAVTESKGGQNVCAPGSDYFLAMEKKKFAELIVQECAALAKSKSEYIQSIGTDDRGDQIQLHSLAWQFEEFAYAIKKHFGVE